MVGLGTHRTKEEKARIVMEVLSNSSTISEICRKFNVASSAVYKWRDEFIPADIAAMEHGRSTVEASPTRENNELKGIIGELTIANETFIFFEHRSRYAVKYIHPSPSMYIFVKSVSHMTFGLATTIVLGICFL